MSSADSASAACAAGTAGAPRLHTGRQLRLLGDHLLFQRSQMTPL